MVIWSMWRGLFSREDPHAVPGSRQESVQRQQQQQEEQQPDVKAPSQKESNIARQDKSDNQKESLSNLSDFQVYDVFERSDGSRVSAPRRKWIEVVEDDRAAAASSQPPQQAIAAGAPPQAPTSLGCGVLTFPDLQPWVVVSASASSKPAVKGRPPPPPLKAKCGARPPLPKAGGPAVPKKAQPAPPPFGKRLHWKLLPASSLEDTIFKELKPWEEVVPPLDTRKIEQIFAPVQPERKPSSATERRLPTFGSDSSPAAAGATSNGTGKRPSGCQQVCLLDPKRAQNLAIVLRQVTMPTEELCDELRWMRVGPSVTGDMLEHVYENLLPPLLECSEIATYNGPTEALRDVERQLLPLARLPRIRQRVRIVLFSKTMPVASAGLLARIQSLQEACVQVRQSSAFRLILGTVLRVGNYLNHGVDTPDAGGGVEVKGFTIESLLKLRDFRAAQGGEVSALHCVVLHLLPADPTLLSTLRKELRGALEPCEGAGAQCAAEGLSELREAIARLHADIQFMRSEIENYPESYRLKDPTASSGIEQGLAGSESPGTPGMEASSSASSESEAACEASPSIAQAEDTASNRADPLVVLEGQAKDAQEMAERLDGELDEALKTAVRLLGYFGERERREEAWHLSPEGIEVVEHFFAIIREFVSSLEDCWREVQDHPRKLRLDGLINPAASAAPGSASTALSNSSPCHRVATADQAAGPIEALRQQVAAALKDQPSVGHPQLRRRPSPKA